MRDTNAEKASAVYRFFSKPIVGIVGSIASIVGLALAIYFYLDSNYYREVVYLVNPAKAVVVKAGQLSRLSVILDGKILSTDVTAAQVAFWNEGKASIRSEHILQPFKLVTSHQVRIIEASVRKKSREPVLINLDTNRIDQGELGISWNILEKGDGAILQIIFAGPPTTPISIKGVVEGQSHPKNLGSSFLRSSDEKPVDRKQFGTIMLFAMLSMPITLFVLVTWLYITGRRMSLTQFLAPIAMIVVSFLMWFLLRQPEPPFGF